MKGLKLLEAIQERLSQGEVLALFHIRQLFDELSLPGGECCWGLDDDTNQKIATATAMQARNALSFYAKELS